MSSEVEVIKGNIDLMLLPGARLFTDNSGQEWIMIPSQNSQEQQANGKYTVKNPCRIWAGETKNGYQKRVLNVDITPYIGIHPEWGHTHLIKFYKADPSIPKNDSVHQNVILGNCKSLKVTWNVSPEAFQPTQQSGGRQSYKTYEANGYQKKPYYNNNNKQQYASNNQPRPQQPQQQGAATPTQNANDGNDELPF